MTQESYTAYLATLQCNIADLADIYANYRKINDCRAKETGITLTIADAMWDVLACFKLTTEELNNNTNCLTIDEMEKISNFMNDIFDLTYCIDFKL